MTSEDRQTLAKLLTLGASPRKSVPAAFTQPGRDSRHSPATSTAHSDNTLQKENPRWQRYR
ncbi:hypothetical protein STENM223S_09995 [Streptomyces tendae]